MANSLIPPSTSEDKVLQDRYNQELADKYNSLVTQITNIPDTYTTVAEITAYLRGLKV